jgi:hypothetical protein
MNKKYIAVTACLLAGTMMRRPVDTNQKAPHGYPLSAPSSPSEGKRMIMTTGDPVIDAKLKVLNEEMEAKIKALRDEYQAKIKALIGDRKLLPMVVASGSPARMMQGEKGERNGQMTGSTTERDDKQRARMGDVRGVTTDSSDNERGVSKIKAFFKGFFGGAN